MLKHVHVLFTLAVAFFVKSGNAAAQPVEWHFIGVASYQYNLNRPGSASNQLRIFDTSDKTMRLNLAGLSLVKAAAPFGFQVDLVSGKDVPLFASAGAPNPKGIDFKQAFVSWKAPGGLEIRAGKFNTTAGYEVIPDWSNQNGNYSISFLSGYAMPITHTGLRASYPLTPATTLTAGVNRGWDKITDNNASPSYELAVTSNPSPWLTLIVDTHQGPERADKHDWRQLYDAVVIVTRQPWTFAAGSDYATEQNAGRTERWYGAAFYARYTIDPRWALAGRVEEFRDATGSRTGVAQRLREITLTADWNVHPNVVLRVEGRVDHSSSAVFERSGPPSVTGGQRHQQPTAALAVIVKK